MGGGSEKEKYRNRAAGKSHLGKRHKGRYWEDNSKPGMVFCAKIDLQ